MREAGLCAAAASWAFGRWVDRLADDHRRAATLVEPWPPFPGLPTPTRSLGSKTAPSGAATSGSYSVNWIGVDMRLSIRQRAVSWRGPP
jgi:hypothetical protein